MEVQTRIAEYMKLNGIKKIHVANAAGISRNRFSKIINKHTKMSADEYERVCSVLGVSPSKFMIDPTKQTE